LSSDERTLVPASDYLNDPPWEGYYINRQEFVKIRGGTDILPHAFADYLTEQIHLATPVESIEQNSAGVVVRVSAGTEFSADRVLCTVPLPVLNRIQFSPQLSDEKIEASSGGYDYLNLTRVFMQFVNRFWESEELNGWGNTDWPEEIWHPTWDRGGPRGVLLSYLSFNRADEADQLSEADRIEHVLSRWGSVFPGVQDHVEAALHFRGLWRNGQAVQLLGQHLTRMKPWPHTLVRLKVEFTLLANTRQMFMDGCRAHLFQACGRPQKSTKEINFFSI
jgi:monoamine oxidase